MIKKIIICTSDIRLEKFIFENGDMEYYIEGTYIKHREDGPAVERGDHYVDYYLNGRRCYLNKKRIRTNEEFEKYKKLMILM